MKRLIIGAVIAVASIFPAFGDGLLGEQPHWENGVPEADETATLEPHGEIVVSVSGCGDFSIMSKSGSVLFHKRNTCRKQRDD